MFSRKDMNIRDLTIDELNDVINSYGEKPYRARQIFEWLHKHMILDLSDASNLSKDLISKLKSDFELGMPSIEKEYVSKIDETKKYLIKLHDGSLIEAVLMKYKYGYSLCISSEVGCNMGCKFCASTIGGLKRNLEAYEMLSEVYLISKHNDIRVSNIVIMGIGEPLQNFDNVIKFLMLISSKLGQNISLRNITLSTCGIVEKIYILAKLNIPITLALSLHAPNQKIREKLMPIAKKYDLKDVMEAMASYFETTNRRITFEYSLVKGVNSDRECALELVRLFEDSFKDRHVDFNVNLISVNKIDERDYIPPEEKDINAFKDILDHAGINTLIRRKLGKDISGSCGQLRMSVK